MPIPLGPHDFVVNVNGDIIHVDYSKTYKIGTGLRTLRKASYLDATHDSSSHPTNCFPGTRKQHIKDITRWASALTAEHHFQIMWLQGPAGVGKSALAQTCAERVGSRLAATFFFSRTRKCDNPRYFFTSIAYQLTVRYASLRTKLDKKISEDPTLVQKAIAVQFHQLIVVPLQELKEEGKAIRGDAIFIDGLDECAGEDAQCTIIDTIATSIRNQTTPFVWSFFSRPEPRIVAKFSEVHIRQMCWRVTLPVSREANGEIALYLRDRFHQIRTQYDICSANEWPSETDVHELVRRSAGLYSYAACAVRYISEGGILGPEGQLLSILNLPTMSSGTPWSSLDALYTLIMEQIPKDILPNTLKLLLVCRTISSGSPVIAAIILGFSLPTFSAALRKLHSVIEVTRSSNGLPESLNFHHASFTDFLEDPRRSKVFCIKTPALCASVLARLVSPSGFGGIIDDIPPSWVLTSHDQTRRDLKQEMFAMFWQFGSYARLNEDLLQHLSVFDYQEMLGYQGVKISNVMRFFKNIPPTWQKKIMQPYYSKIWCWILQVDGLEAFALTLGNGSRGYRDFVRMRRKVFFKELQRQKPGAYFYLAFLLYWTVVSFMFFFLFLFPRESRAQ